VSTRRYNECCLTGLVVLCCGLACAGFSAARASAFAGNPAWTVSAVARPANFVAGDDSGDDFFEVVVTNTGDAPTENGTVTITDTLPHGLVLDPAGVSGSELLKAEALSCSGLTCTYSGVVAAGDTFTLKVPVDVEADAKSSAGNASEANVVRVSGGGVSEASVGTPVLVSSVYPGFGIAPGSFSNTLSSSQAGAHADMTTSFYLNTDREGAVEGQLKDLIVDLPPGFAGDAAATSTCTAAQLNEHPAAFNAAFANCPLASQVGTITVTLGGTALHGFIFSEVAPVYNMQPAGHEVARLGFKTAIVSSNVVIRVRPGSYGLQATAPNLNPADLEVIGSKLTVWGVPGDPSHDLMRGTVCELDECKGPEESPVGSEKQPLGASDPDPAEPFLSNPTECTEVLPAELWADTWQHPLLSGESSEPPSLAPLAMTGLGSMTGCERPEFGPGLLAQTTSTSAESPTGLDVTQSLSQTYSNPLALATAHLRSVTVTLPEGVTVNPSAGEGLGACSPAQYAAEALETAAGAGCPSDSSLGTVSIHTPVLSEEATGSLFLAQPYDNPFSEPGHPGGSLLAVYVVARIPGRGVIVKLAGKVTLNPVTGQLVTSFEDLPQLPFDKATFSFRPGDAAPLVTPPACGEYVARGLFGSWAEPEQLVSGLSAAFPITQGVGGGACPSGGVPPFSPQVFSGTVSNAAGSYSPLDLRITRNDGEQEITGFSTVLPPGLSGDLSGIPFCPETDIEAARMVTGKEELEHPSCPAASEIGHTLVGAGVGADSVLAQTPGKIYLAGPYHGAPLSIVSITSATVGPFDLGTVVIRFGLQVNPVTAQVEVDAANSEPIPHIIDGIVVHVRDIRVYIDRPNFTLNPTSCDRMTIKATITGAGADPANPADQAPVTASSPFQAADCQNLAFKPGFKVTTSGKTSKANGASLTAKVSFPASALGTQANIAYVKVDLPKQLPSRLTTLQKACLASVFETNPANCPTASIVGHAKAITPLIPVPLEGPAYFVSHGGEAFPSLIVVLQGYGITIDLTGTTFISKAGITSSTFKTVPDQPVTTFELTLPEGKYSALAANGNLCKTKLTMPTHFIAQNGTEIHQTTNINVTNCPKHHKTKKTKKTPKHHNHKK
jgi:uncharacterized repeat protein (TIGR01451 family)